MGNSTRTLQSVMDEVATIGDLSPVFLNTGGYANQPALSIANAAMSDLISQRFNWKWNRIKISPFFLTSNQQDYASIFNQNVGWLENAAIVDTNNTSFPKPTNRVEVVRDLEYSSSAGGQPAQIAWLPNNLLEQGVWPGAGTTYVYPVGAAVTPNNPLTNILDGNGNLLVLTTFGVTAAVAPLLPAGSLPGVTVADGTCVWTVADPAAAGFRVNPRPPASGNLWTMRVFAQARAKRFVSLSDTLDPIPDDYSQWFETGVIAYAHRHSATPQVKARYPAMKQEWIEAMVNTLKQADREPESFGFYPDRTVMDAGGSYSITAAWPFPGARRY